MTATISFTEARATLSELLDRVAHGEELIITRHGQPVAVLIEPGALRSRRSAEVEAAADRLRRLIELGRETKLSAEGDLSDETFELLLDAHRADRGPR